MTFELLSPTAAKLSSVNCRSEMHGKDAVPAVDLRLAFDAPNSVLSMFDPWLLTALYHRAGPDQPSDDPQQGHIEGVEAISDVPNLCMPMLASPVRWSKEYSGYELTFDFGIGGKSNITLTDCHVNSVQFAPKEGGTVEVGVRVQCSKGLTEKILGKLATLVQHDVQFTLKAPEVALEVFDQRTPEEALAGAV